VIFTLGLNLTPIFTLVQKVTLRYISEFFSITF